MLNASFLHLRKMFIGTLRRQLISGVAIVHAVLMALFVWDLTDRQRDLLLERQTDQAQALARSVATSAAGWVAARDLYGLQEIITAQSRYPELLFAMIVDKNGLVLAHSDTSRLGLYIQDLPALPKAAVLTRSPELVDAVSPIVLADQAIGWVRIGLGQKTTAARLNKITRDGVIYALVAIVIGSLLAWYMGTRLTKRLHAIEMSADAVENGDTSHRAIVEGSDEVSHVAHAFNQMLDSMVTSRKELEESEEKYRLAMGAAKDGLWDWNVTTGNVYFNPAWGNILGMETIGNDYYAWETRVHEEDKERILATLNAHLAGETEIWQEEHRLRKNDGTWAWVLGRGQVVKRDSNGKALRMIGTMTDVSQKKENEEIIWQQANYDSLTSLPNRKLLHELLDQRIKQAQREEQPLWIFFLDLDSFKEINDTLGHHKGDALLIMVTERIQNALRESDTVARLAGDEFVIILSNVSEITYVDSVAAKLVDAIGQSFKLNDDEIYISASIGIANYPKDADNTDDLLKFADQSMYVAKQEGKNRYSYFTPLLQQESLKRIQISKDLRHGIANHEFQLYYQPIVDLSSDKTQKAEALIRWVHPDKGLISPAEFIPIAEKSDIICEIGAWVFDHAFKQLSTWQPHSSDTFQLSINMSPFQLRVADIKYDNWLLKLAEHGISGKQIVIEITEGLLLESEQMVNDRLLQYRDAGVQVAIDDFGTGYSSLSYLKEFDIDYLKIDQSFIRNLEPGSSEESLSEAIVVMAHKLGLKVIAEGVETEQQRDMLKAMGCDYGQGYFFSKPIPFEEFERLFIRTPNTLL